MATGTLTPTPWQTVLDANGNPVSGALIYTVTAGLSWPGGAQTTYTDVGLTVPNPNPIVADSSGRYVAFLPNGQSFKYIVTDASGNPIRTQDNIVGGPGTVNTDVIGTAGATLTAGMAAYLSDGSGGKTAGLWYLADNTNAYSSLLPYVGIVVATLTAGTSGNIRLAGSMQALPGTFTVGADYYLATAGNLTSSAPTLNARIIARADTTTSLIIGVKPPVLTGTAGQLFASSGSGADPAFQITPGTSGFVLTSNGPTSLPSYKVPANVQVTLLKANAGSNDPNVTADLDTVAITGLTVRDRLLVYVTAETDQNAILSLSSVTDAHGTVTTMGTLAAGNAGMWNIAVSDAPSSTTKYKSLTQSSQLPSGATQNALTEFAAATAWTGSWTLALRNASGSTPGTLLWSWLVSKVAGQ